MFISELKREQRVLQLIRKNHLEKLFAQDNPSGILICQKHANGVRWRKRDIVNGHLVSRDLSKKEKELAEKLAVNLYRIICIQYIQKQLNGINALIRDQSFGQQKCVERFDDENNTAQSFDLQRNKVQLLPDKSVRMLIGKVRNCPRVPADFFQVSSPYSQLIIPFLLKEYSQIIDWYIGDYPHNNEFPEHLQYGVKLGFKVRSKSEVTIADWLYEGGILFHYEEQLLLSGDASYPDFFVPITFVEKYAWEHFGAMDKEKYFHRTRGKVLGYMDHQWFPGINMITTYETKNHPLSEELVALYVRWLKDRYRCTFLDLPPDESFNMYDLAAYAKYSRMGQK